MNAAQGLVVGNFLTEGAFGLDLWNFITSNEVTSYSKSSASRITLKELLTGWRQHPLGGGRSASEYQLAWNNVQKNWMNMAIGMVGTPIAFKVAKKVLRKPVLTPLNKVVKMAGLNDVKVG